MGTVQQFTTSAEFWSEMVAPDFDEYLANTGDLRVALHLAISLFHMADWVYHSHETAVKASFTFMDKNNNVQTITCSDNFANALEQLCEDFGRIRGIANSAKHLKLRQSSVRSVQNAPSHAANTYVETTGYGVGGYGVGGYGGTPHVILEGAIDMEFSQIAQAVFDMWVSLKSSYGW